MSSAKAASDNLLGFPRRHTVYCFFSVFTPHPVGKRSIAITKLCMSACISVFARLSGKYPSNLHQICYARYLQPWFGPPLTASRYVIYLRLMDDVLYFCTVMARNRHILKNGSPWNSTDLTPQRIPALTHQGAASNRGWNLMSTIALFL